MRSPKKENQFLKVSKQFQLGLHKARGIVLHKNKFSDADAGILLLTDGGIKINFIVKGILKSKKRPILAVEPGSLVSLDYYSHIGEQFHYVKEISLEERFDNIKNDYISTLFMYLFLELIEKTIPPGLEEPKFYILLQSSFREIEASGVRLRLIPFFKSKLLYLMGIIPKEFNCVRCGKSMKETQNAKINYFNFEIICGNCSVVEENELELILLFKHIVHISYYNFLSLNPTKNQILKMSSILDSYILYTLGIETKSHELLYKSIKDIKEI